MEKTRYVKIKQLWFYLFLSLFLLISLKAIINIKQNFNTRSKANVGDTTVSGAILEETEVNSIDITKSKKYFYGQEKINFNTIGRFQPKTLKLSAASYVVQPIIFVASDKSEKPEYISGVDSSIELIDRWYSGALETTTGYKFNRQNVVVYHAPQPFVYYKCISHTPCNNYDGISPNIQEALIQAGYPLWVEGNILTVFVVGAGGWAGGTCVPNCFANWPAPGPAGKAGLAILGDWALDAISTGTNSECLTQMGTACNKVPQQGAIAHELGHGFGLAHAQDDPASLMYGWWNFPNTTLLNYYGNMEKALLRNESPFFTTQACNKNAQIIKTDFPTSVKKSSSNIHALLTSITYKNYGWCKWEKNIVDINLIKDNVWLMNNLILDKNVLPARNVKFKLILTAPTTIGDYFSNWRLRENGQYFGPTVNKTIKVTN